MEEIKLSNTIYIYRMYSFCSVSNHTRGNLGSNIFCNEKTRHLYKDTKFNAYFMKCTHCGHNFGRNYNIPKSLHQLDLNKYANEYLDYRALSITIII